MNPELATKIIESLRSGIPTRDSTRNLNSSPSRINRQLNDDLRRIVDSQGIPKGHLIRGGFGQGKTHELTLIEHNALDQRFAVSRITFNRQLSGQNLHLLYNKLATSIRTPQSRLLGIRHLLDNKMSADLPDSPLQKVDRYIHPFPATILEAYFYAENQDLLYNAFLGGSVPIPEVRKIYANNVGAPFPKFEKFTPTKHAKAYFQTMADVLVWCGFYGWVILIDEIELTYRLSKVGKVKAYQNLYWLLNWSETQTFPIYTVGAITDSTIALWREPKGKDQKSDIDLITNLALEKYGDESQQEMTRFFNYASDDKLCPVISKMSQDDLVQFLEKVTELHGISYGWNPDVNVRDVIQRQGNQPTRLYIRALMETLDMRYLGDKQFVPKVTALESADLSEDDSYFNEENA